MRAPIDSAEARELREAALEAEDAARLVDLAAEQQRARAEHDHATRCRRGWLGEDDAGRPIPCLLCRPWLAETNCHACSAPPVACRIRTRRGPCCDQCDHRPHREDQHHARPA